MKINPINLKAINSYKPQLRPVKQTEQGASFADKIEISSAAKEMQVTADYNTERAVRVQQLKADIQSGEYKVNARQVAEDMLKYYRF
ncbi:MULTISPECIES: flagellar biosynthesis anti-sigma factor FlgM [Bacillales]|uniref:Negative regulator of flagellin synthesis n=1 Tax=Lysinibacillus louembei TaxID=1470088 RepID=A0ABZ0RW05_9BACI|nr:MULTISPECIES: flagellar biosynthesis anti-sigma factor FlgM [Bacillales]MCT6925685.1 flagellar biosynthesis anti-sigma factor FlgM [Metasolibacillus sp.]MCT6941005.1 flagellar biosynthesis anti-sigma factor FlgM [Metasolibacillus sp.]WPK12418.1 flagellar biosynthesis anti-sigma factor FlgM [Lysinibacillus louembei]